MKKAVFILVAIVFFWAGFVSSISFMEAWLKFQAPGVTLPIGLGIGKKVFHSLNHMEWIFFLVAVIALYFSDLFRKRTFLVFFAVVIFILLVQTFFLLPALTERANQIIDGKTPGKSLVHVIFGILEIIKVTVLLWTGFLGLRKP